MFSTPVFHAALVAFHAATAAAQPCDNGLTPDYSAPVVGSGWSYQLIANGLDRPRSIIVDEQGALLVLDAGAGVKRLTFDDDGPICLSRRDEKVVVESAELNHGLALSTDGRTLYASTSDKVYSWPYDAGRGQVTGENTTVIEGMHNGGHSTRTLLVSNKAPGMLAVSRGSDGNIDELCLDEASGHCQIRAFNVSDGDRQNPYDFTTDGVRLGWGLRNSVGLAEHPIDGGIWTVENSVDNLQRAGEDIHRDNPGEELNSHGYLDGSAGDQGGNYGYPDCLALWSTEDFPELGSMDTGDQFDANSTGSLNDTACTVDRIAPRFTFQAHTAPLDILFSPNGSEALVTFHGSWNRDDPVGYKLSSIAFSDGSPDQPSDSKTATTDVLSNANLGDCPRDCFRPVGLAWGSEERLFMTSDSTGEIYVLVKSEISATDSSPPPSSTPDNGVGFARTPRVAAVAILAVAVGRFASGL